MFAVPGWAVSAANLKAETASAAAGAVSGSASGGDSQDAPGKADKSKKRKRPSGPNVTSSNVADLWERVIECKEPVKKAKTDAEPRSKDKKKKRNHDSDAVIGQNKSESRDADVRETSSEKPVAVLEADAKEKPKKDKRKKKQQKSKLVEDDDDEKNFDAPVAREIKQPVKQVPKLTPLQASMREKLISARFRHLNETLYTKPSSDAFKLFEDSPEMFQEYHEGFRRQVNVWPQNPVDGYLEAIRLRGRQKPPQREKWKPSHDAPPPASRSGIAPLLRTNGLCTIADLGCGDAKLAEALQSDKKKLKLEILSYDLQSPSPLVTRADIANLPLADGSVNVVIFCLALMGTNWLDFIEEAYRILHWKGELWIAEIKSRFAPSVGKGKKGVVTHSVGNRKKQAVKKSKEPDAELEQSNQKDLAIEVDGEDDRRGETDVSAFVEALRKRGFILQGEADLSNKMFVNMHFVKAAPAIVGKGAATTRDSSHGGGKKRNAMKFVEEDQVKVDENSILKPCVYKLR